MIIDTTVLIMISIWEEHLTKVKKNSVYYITNMKMLNFNGISVTTQWIAKLSESEPFELVDSCVEEIICCPEIINKTVNAYQICNNPNYRKKTICSGRGDTNNMFLIKKVAFKKGIIRVKCSCPIRSIFWAISYILQSLLKKLFEEKFIDDPAESSDSIITQLLILDNHGFKLTRASNIVASIEPHGIWINRQLLPCTHIFLLVPH